MFSTHSQRGDTKGGGASLALSSVALGGKLIA